MRYEERGQGYRDVEKVGEHCTRVWQGLSHHEEQQSSEIYVYTHNYPVE